jgi:hypothetical protein
VPAAPAGEQGMQYWQDVDGDNTQLIAVSDEAVYAETLKNAVAVQQAQRLAAGESPTQVFGDKATHITLRSLKKVQLSTGDNDIDFVIEGGKDDKTESLGVEDDGIRQQVFEAVDQATHGRFKRYEDSYGKARAGFASLATLTALLFGTKIAYGAAVAIRAADEIEISGRKKGFKQMVVWVLDFLGPWGVSILGGLLCALAIYTFVQRIQAPPLLQILQAKPYRPQGPVKTTLKYAVLAAVWVVMAPGLVR